MKAAGEKPIAGGRDFLEIRRIAAAGPALGVCAVLSRLWNASKPQKNDPGRSGSPEHPGWGASRI